MSTASADGRFDVMSAACPTRQVINRIGDRWSLLVLYALESGGTVRHAELRRRVEGISQKMLTQTLRHMERDGLLIRTVHPVVPPRVEYKLTELGMSLGAAFCGVWIWAAENLRQVENARSVFDERSVADRSKARPLKA
jgi:DNA-binding HxlR family transcriptional regulator